MKKITTFGLTASSALYLLASPAWATLVPSPPPSKVPDSGPNLWIIAGLMVVILAVSAWPIRKRSKTPISI
jgi:hypothetical protein